MEKRVCNDSRQVTPGAVFAAVDGANCDGHAFIPEAVRRGAVKIVHSRDLPEYLPGIEYEKVPDTYAYYAEYCRKKYRCPDEKLDLFGVTGTNGKTTTVYILRHLLSSCGMLSTVEYFDGVSAVPAKWTTPEPEVLFGELDRMRRNGMKRAAMELSSHALSQSRLGDARFAAAIFTNFTGDHLDFHRTMDNYFEAKKMLFSRHLRPDGTAVINGDDPAGERFARAVPPGRRVRIFAGADGKFSGRADYLFCITRLDGEGSSFTLNGREFRTNLIGRHNVCNLCGALAAALECGCDAGLLAERLSVPLRVPGRLERIALPNGAEVYVDYAHTDDALGNVLKILRKTAKGRLTAVFGCGGDRDRTKRIRMGKVAAELADKVIVTSDNPRSEDPQSIIDEILCGIPAGVPGIAEPDRAAAIELALRESAEGECILVAGKGHENYQEIGGVRHEFSDFSVIEAKKQEIFDF